MRFCPAAFICLAFLGLLPMPSALAQTPLPVATAPGAVTLPLSRSDNHLIVSVLVNGKPARFIIDTGASVSFLSPQSATRLGIASGKSVTAKGATNTPATLSKIDTLQLGDFRIKDTPVGIVEFPAELEADGVLGMPLFAAYTVTLDYYNKRLILMLRDRETLMPGATVLPLKQEKNQLLSVPGSVFGIAGWYEVDTGNTDALILFAPFVRKNRLEEKLPKRFKIPIGIGVGGIMYGQSARLPLLMLGEKSDVVGVIAPIIEMHDGAEGGFLSETLSGNIGAGIWSRFTVTFDVKRKKLYLQKNADFDKPFAFDTTGIVARFLDGAMEVLSVLPDSPAQDAEIMVGDRISSVNGVAIEPGYDTPARTTVRRAPAGTTLKLVYRRKNETADRTATIITRNLL